MKAIQIAVDGWEKESLMCADANMPFQILGIETRRHLSFCVKLCVAYKLKAVQTRAMVTFTPFNQAHIPALNNVAELLAN